MTERISINFNDLVNGTFQDGTVHIKYLETLFKILVTQLKLGEVKVSVEDLKSFDSATKTSDAINHSMNENNDPILKVLPRSEDLKKNLCKSDDNSVVDMLNVLNVTKRIEALEISIHSMTSLMGNVLKMEEKFSERLEFHNASIVQGNAESLKEAIREKQKVSTKTSSISSQTQQAGQVSLGVSISSLSHEVFQSTGENLSITSAEVSTSLELRAKSVDNTVHDSFQENQEVSEMASTRSQEICDIQKKIVDFQDMIDDLMFACELNDGKVEETLGEIKQFNSKIFCLKTEVKTLLTEVKEIKEKLVAVDEKYETMNNVKTNKSYVDNCLIEKAFASDLTKLLKHEEFDLVLDVMQLKFGLMEEHLATLQMNQKKALACFKSELDEMMKKNELLKFKEIVATSFQDFVQELKLLLHPLIKAPIGIGGTQVMNGFNCVSCDTKITMNKSNPNVPKLESMSYRFIRKMDISYPKSVDSSSNADFRRIFCNEKKSKVAFKNQQTEQLNFPYSQPCFIVSQDNSIIKADPLKCLKSPKYLKV